MKKETEIVKKEVEKALNEIKKHKETKGTIRSTEKKIVIIDGKKDFSGRILKIKKILRKNGVEHVYNVGTKWDTLDVFSKKNLSFSEADFE